jgi:hypothetical protein
VIPLLSQPGNRSGKLYLETVQFAGIRSPNGWGCSCYVVGARSLRGARRLGGDPEKQLPENWQALDSKTGAPAGIDKGWAYAPGRTSSALVSALRPKLDELPAGPSADLIQSWLRSTTFEAWMRDPEGLWPLVVLTAEQAGRIGANKRVADISAETMRKQLVRHSELTARDYASAQKVVNDPTRVIKDGEKTLIFLRDEADGHLVVVKATLSGDGLFVTSLRRMSGRAGERQREIRRLLSRE